MCFSARVKQRLKELSRRYEASIDLAAFERVFKDRNKGSKAKIPKALEDSFLSNPMSPLEESIAKEIIEWREKYIRETEKTLFEQIKRLHTATKSFTTKATKKSENEVRISTNKIENLKSKLSKYQSSVSSNDDSQIYPNIYAPLIVMENGKRMIKPFRYLLRPKGQKESFDRKFSGCYNARRDNLNEVFWWKTVFGKNHGILIIDRFSENVKKHNFEHRDLKKGESEENMIITFEPEDHQEMIVPCIYDQNDEGDFTLHSFALITDEPNSEVAAAGHDRTPIVMKEKYIDLWLSAKCEHLKDYDQIFTDKQPTHFQHQIAA